MITKQATCRCGTAEPVGEHVVGTYGCVRFITDAPKPAGKHPVTGCDMWEVDDGDIITDYTLRHQRGYHCHENGQWSRHHGSINSLEMD